jgi:exonuclease VII large subunit
MKPMNLGQVVRNIDRRLERVEQILPTLPTREELDRKLDEKIATLVTREEFEQKLDAKVAQLVTKEEFDRKLDEKLALLVTREELDQKFDEKLRPLNARIDRLDQRITEEAERSRTYTQIHYESLKGDIQLLADGVVKVQLTLDRMVSPKLDDHERRLTALEDAHAPTGKGRLR